MTTPAPLPPCSVLKQKGRCSSQFGQMGPTVGQWALIGHSYGCTTSPDISRAHGGCVAGPSPYQIHWSAKLEQEPTARANVPFAQRFNRGQHLAPHGGTGRDAATFHRRAARHTSPHALRQRMHATTLILTAGKATVPT